MSYIADDKQKNVNTLSVTDHYGPHFSSHGSRLQAGVYGMLSFSADDADDADGCLALPCLLPALNVDDP